MSEIQWYDEQIRFFIHTRKGEFEKAIPISDYLLTVGSSSIQILVNYALAEGFYREGKMDEAIAAIGRLQKIRGRDLNWAVFYPKSFYLLGHIYEEKGEIEFARENYGFFLEIWEDADDDLPDLIDAEERLVNLEGLALK